MWTSLCMCMFFLVSQGNNCPCPDKKTGKIHQRADILSSFRSFRNTVLNVVVLETNSVIQCVHSSFHHFSDKDRFPIIILQKGMCTNMKQGKVSFWKQCWRMNGITFCFPSQSETEISSSFPQLNRHKRSIKTLKIYGRRHRSR